MGALNAISTEAREVMFEALMSVAWADRELADEERAAARAVRLSLGLVLKGDGDEARCPGPIDALPVDGLNQRDRELIYLCCSWMALADEVEHPEEMDVLGQLKTHLRVGHERADWLAAEAAKMRAEQSGEEPWWRAFDKLITRAAKSLGA